MSHSQFPCIECGEPFDTRLEQEAHWVENGHGPKQVELDAIDRARYSVMGEAAPEPLSAYRERRELPSRRKRLKLLRGQR